MPIPDDRCQRCTRPLADSDGVFIADRDRVCDVCAGRARDRGEDVTPVEHSLTKEGVLAPSAGARLSRAGRRAPAPDG